MSFRKRQLIEDVTAHFIATVITLGFFTTVLVSLLGFVDLKDATTASFVGIVLGYVAGSLNPVLSRYFKSELPETLSQQPVSQRQQDQEQRPE